jgi:FdhE protein
VAGRFLQRILGRPSPPGPEVQQAIAELKRLGQENTAWSGHVAFLREIVPEIFAGPVAETPPALPPDQAAAKLTAGVPLLRGEPFGVDANTFRRRWQRVCAAAQSSAGGEAAGALAEAMKGGRLDPAELVREVLAGSAEKIHTRADELGLSAGLAATVLRFTLFPVLAAASAALAPLREGVSWGRGYCPTCGSWPLLGEFRGLEQLRFLRCGLCAAEWEFPRLRCPFCGTRDHDMLGYLHVEGQEARQRAATCEACRGYVKMVASLGALGGPQLFVADLATMHLDLVAVERGYSPPA